MVALSVSTSARLSSDFTVSPTFLFHATIFPSVIVSLNKGIRITVTPKEEARASASTPHVEGAAAGSAAGLYAEGGAEVEGALPPSSNPL